MRRAITFGFYLLMVAVGAWLTYEWFVLRSRGLVFVSGGFLTLFGAYMLWTDFLSPSRE
jgi:CDP-diglyceride synthetase